IALAVAEGFHETGWRIAQMKRNRISGGLLNIFRDRSECGIDCIRLWSQREIGHGWRQRELAFGCAEKIVSVASSESDTESLWRCETYVLHRHADNTSGDVQRIFARGEHAPEPVERCVDVAVAHTLMQR